MTKKKTAETQPELAAEDNLASEEFDLEKAIKDAKGSFDLGSRIKNKLKPRRASLLVYLDQEALDEDLINSQSVDEIEHKLNLAQNAIERGDTDAEEMTRASKVLKEALERLLADRKRIKAALAEATLTLHLQSLPSDTLEALRANSVKSAKKLTKEAPDKLEEVFTRQFTARVLKDSCVAVFDGNGAVSRLTKLEDAFVLLGHLHPVEVNKLRHAVDLIVLNTSTISASTDNPGF